MHREVSARVFGHLKAYLDMPQVLLIQNDRLLSSGIIPTDDQAALQALFLQQATIPVPATSIYFGNTAGGLAGAGHEGERNAFYTTGTEGFTAGRFRKIETTPDGRAGAVVASLPAYDARQRPWYTAALERDGGTWGKVYVLFTRHDLSLPASRAVRAPDGRLIGVLGVDLFVSAIGDFLEDLHAGTDGITYIMEPSGLLIASSTAERPFHIEGPLGTPTGRLSALDSVRPEVAESARLILSGALSPDHGPKTMPPTGPEGGGVPQVGRITVGGETFVVGATPFEDPRGLSWIIATVVPVAAHEAPIVAVNLRTLALTTLAVALIAGLATLMIRRALAPLADVAASAGAVGRGDLSRTLPERGGDEVGAVARAFNEMIRRLRAAQALQDRHLADLSAAEDRFRRLFRNAEVAICNEDLSDLMAGLDALRTQGVTDLRAHLRAHPEVLRDFAARVRVIDANPATRRLLGLDPEGGPVPRFADHFMDTTWDLFVEMLCTAWTGGAQFRMEGRIRTRSGEERDVLFCTPIPKTAEESRVVPVSLVDLTEQKRAEAALRLKNEELERSNAELESFAHVAAHDLREPLRTVTSYVTLLRRRLGDRLALDEGEFMGFIHQGALRMDALVSDLLEFARVGRADRPAAAVSLRAVVEAAMDGMRAQIDLTEARVSVAQDLPTVRGHADDLGRVFTNLIGNAVKYRQPGRPLQIEIGAEVLSPEVATGAPMVRVFVRDTGIGLPAGEGQEERIFGLFKRLHHREAFGGGTGLGLAICKKVVEYHGGRIWAESAGENQGSTIWFTLPLA
ncbi:ATP-binding protein [Roseospira navarrensis]|uniref:ATP-binding protein n=1 Tax=Roseospira navarrensis TaxID=140058 RepID=UPI00147872F1|nr:ATP-binding protein [Roseospira navarrensis]